MKLWPHPMSVSGFIQWSGSLRLLRAKPWLSLFTLLTTLALLALIFYSYLRPDFIVDLANRLWLCM